MERVLRKYAQWLIKVLNVLNDNDLRRDFQLVPKIYRNYVLFLFLFFILRIHLQRFNQIIIAYRHKCIRHCIANSRVSYLIARFCIGSEIKSISTGIVFYSWKFLIIFSCDPIYCTL